MTDELQRQCLIHTYKFLKTILYNVTVGLDPIGINHFKLKNELELMNSKLNKDLYTECLLHVHTFLDSIVYRLCHSVNNIFTVCKNFH